MLISQVSLTQFKLAVGLNADSHELFNSGHSHLS